MAPIDLNNSVERDRLTATHNPQCCSVIGQFRHGGGTNMAPAGFSQCSMHNDHPVLV